MRRVNNFDDWIDYFHYWQDSIGVAAKEFKGSAVSEEFRGKSFATFNFDAKFGEPEAETIEFGHYKGQSKWPTLMHIPDQRIRDALLNLIVYQGDTEFASVEQQRALLQNAPSDYDLFALMRVMSEEMRHGWQMSYLLLPALRRRGPTGGPEAPRAPGRRGHSGCSGSFNEIVENWLDFFTYTQFIDRDGKFQLKMLSTSAFHPLARSMGPMLKEESFHLGTGNNGLLRIVKAGKIPPEIMQRYFNKWIPTAFDLFGTDNSLERALGLRLGAQGTVQRAGDRRRGRCGAPQRGRPRTLPAGDRPAGRPPQHGDSGARAAAVRARAAVQPEDRDLGPEVLLRHRRGYRSAANYPAYIATMVPTSGRSGVPRAVSSRRMTGSSPRRRRTATEASDPRAPGRLGLDLRELPGRLPPGR